MVCVPCIFLPILLAIYLKFIQPIVFRFIPNKWKVKFDSIFYPTCSIDAPKSSSKEKIEETIDLNSELKNHNESLNNENKKDS